ncbi:MAG: eRF1 domain 2 [Bdellovibrionota bacterium]
MKLSVIWIDRENANLFHISDDKMERKKLKLNHTDHHTHRRDQLDQNREEPHLFTEAALELAASDRVLIIGPGVAKHHFQSYLVEHMPFIGKKVAGIETVDHPSDEQIAALAKKYFERVSA